MSQPDNFSKKMLATTLYAMTAPFASIAPVLAKISDPASVSRMEINSVESLGKYIHSVRKELNLSQQQFADMTGVGRRFISELEAGKPTLEFGRVLKVCQAAGIELMAVKR
jgi:y4mF family transcriptional regulator